MERHVRLLSDRERRVLQLLAEGCNDASISSQLQIAEEAVRKLVKSMLRKQGFVSQYQLISWAYREAVIS